MNSADVKELYTRLGSIETKQSQILEQTTKTNGHVRDHGELLASMGEWIKQHDRRADEQSEAFIALAQQVGAHQTYQDQQRGGAQRLAAIWTAAVSVLSAGVGAVMAWLLAPHK